MNVLLIEDEAKVADFIKKGLSENGYNVTVSYDGLTGKRMALQQDYDVIIMAIMLPSINGFELCRQLRSEGLETPVLMLSALNKGDDRVKGFEQGADDYLAKPFYFKELLYRLLALTKGHRKKVRKKLQCSRCWIRLIRIGRISKLQKQIILLANKIIFIRRLLRFQIFL